MAAGEPQNPGIRPVASEVAGPLEEVSGLRGIAVIKHCQGSVERNLWCCGRVQSDEVVVNARRLLRATGACQDFGAPSVEGLPGGFGAKGSGTVQPAHRLGWFAALHGLADQRGEEARDVELLRRGRAATGQRGGEPCGQLIITKAGGRLESFDKLSVVEVFGLEVMELGQGRAREVMRIDGRCAVEVQAKSAPQPVERIALVHGDGARTDAKLLANPNQGLELDAGDRVAAAGILRGSQRRESVESLA